MNAAAWTAVGVWVTAVIYGTILIYAIQQVSEAKRLREERTRPYVIVDLEPGWTTYLKIQNIGATVARNVRFSFEPALASTREEQGNLWEAPLLRDGAETMPPQKQYRLLFYSFGAQPEGAALPVPHVATVTYQDSTGHEYEDRYTLDLRSLLGTAPPPGIENVYAELEKIRRDFDRWTDGGRGLLVHAQDRDEMMRRQREQVEKRRRERDSTAESSPPTI